MGKHGLAPPERQAHMRMTQIAKAQIVQPGFPANPVPKGVQPACASRTVPMHIGKDPAVLAVEAVENVAGGFREPHGSRFRLAVTEALDMGARGDALAVLLDGGPLGAVEVADKVVPFDGGAGGGLALGRLLPEDGGEEGTEDVAHGSQCRKSGRSGRCATSA